MRVLLRRRYLVLTVLVLLIGAATVVAMHPRKKHRKKRPEPAQVDYVREIKPILEARCYSCHGPSKSKGGVRLDRVADLLTGGVIVPGNAAKSLLLAVLSEDENQSQMPPTGDRLSAQQTALIKRWVDEGAVVPAEPDPAATRAIHWAFRPPVALPVPSANQTSNPIDAFLAAGRDQRGLAPNPSAPPAVLLRRVFVDLIGLPPTREELAEFLADTAAGAYERAVDRLLADPRYGERWGRHWMDVWRYSDADGRKAKGDIWWGSPHIWRWRDWIVRSLNEDKGYDRMVTEMLAGDEVTPDDPATAVATGFLVRNWFKMDRNIWLTNTVDHTAKAFLGLSLGCARCHDHKFDPISQKDYYQFRAFFEPHDVRTDPVPGETGPSAHLARACDLNPDAPTWVFVRGDPKAPDKSVAVSPGVPAVFGAVAVDPPPASAKSTGRRLALARWIGARDNPLTARVAVNHIWMRHFGRPLVDNVADFGTRTAAPAQQPLLDWLAVEFMERGWSTKRLHRLIVTSAAYRMSSSARSASAATRTADPDNTFYWRANSRRMEAEVVRDSLLWLAGALEPTAGGPPVDPGRGTETGRRSLYYRYSREDKMTLLTAFDAPGVEECYRREQSVVPQQALALENSEFAWDQARRIARRLEEAAPGAFVTAAFEHVLGRPPTAAEGAACEAFLARQRALLADPGRLTPLPSPSAPVQLDPKAAKQFAERVLGLPLVLGDARPLPAVPPATAPAAQAREYLIHALLNHNDFITVR